MSISDRSSDVCSSDLSLSECWGNYVAFSAQGSSLRVERAALTGMQFYWSRRPDGLLCSSESGVVQALIGRPAIDWEFVSNSLAYINLRTERTGFSAIRELLPGTSLCFDGVALDRKSVV